MVEKTKRKKGVGSGKTTLISVVQKVQKQNHGNGDSEIFGEMQKKSTESHKKYDVHPCAEESTEEIQEREVVFISGQKEICRPTEGQREYYCDQRNQQASHYQIFFRRERKR